MIAAEKSGQGKTMLTCALLSILKSEGMKVVAYKCGPDYIDPMFHRRVLGVPSHNLDSFFSNENQLSCLMGRSAGKYADRVPEGRGRIAVVEGVMGYYDGLGGTTEKASSYETAKLTKTPVILIADASGRSLSVLAAIRGFLSYRQDSNIRGILFNRLSPMLYPALKEKAEQELGIRVAGYIPVLKDFSLESRHLGLIMPEEIPEFKEKTERLADRIRPGIDMEALLAIAGEAKPLSWVPKPTAAVKKKDGTAPVIAVAMDEAFCFYYQDNLDTLEDMGARLLYFSPLRDKKLPEEADGLYLGGGYPELYGKELSENRSMQESIKKALLKKMPCIAECGGFLYLKEWMADREGIRRPMCGVLPGGSRDTGKLTRFGYGLLTSREDGLLGPAGSSFPVHEFHHWDSEENGNAFRFQKPVGIRGWDCGYQTESLYAGFPHLYFYGHYPLEFVKKAACWKEEREE